MLERVLEKETVVQLEFYYQFPHKFKINHRKHPAFIIEKEVLKSPQLTLLYREKQA